ncbi:MAG: SpoIIE family protein phosphatase [Balneolaceae bacterium]
MFYGVYRLQRIIYFHHSKSAQEIVDHILDDIHEFSDGASQHDDMTLVVIKQK